MAGSNRSVLEISGVSKSFGAHKAVHELDLTVETGEFVTLLGPSGCGKTTLLRMISGFERPTSGHIVSEGRDLTSLRPERRPFNMVFQNYALFPHLSVFENVAYGLRAAGLEEREIARRVEDALQMVGLHAQKEQSVQSLSGGMSQRVALVRAIVNQPRILLLDEPLAALDLQLRKRMQVELRDIQQNLGTTFILVTHDQEESLVMSDRIVVMRAGRIEQIGTPHQIYRRPKTRFVAEFIGETSLVEAEVLSAGKGRASVKLANGVRKSFQHYSDTEPAKGSHGVVSVRPEALTVVAPEKATFRGVVSRQVFLGSQTRISVDVAPGLTLNADLTFDQDVRIGQEVGLDIVRNAAVFIADG